LAEYRKPLLAPRGPTKERRFVRNRASRVQVWISDCPQQRNVERRCGKPAHTRV
jgi:hypothetical protein